MRSCQDIDTHSRLRWWPYYLMFENGEADPKASRLVLRLPLLSCRCKPPTPTAVLALASSLGAAFLLLPFLDDDDGLAPLPLGLAPPNAGADDGGTDMKLVEPPPPPDAPGPSCWLAGGKSSAIWKDGWRAVNKGGPTVVPVMSRRGLRSCAWLCLRFLAGLVELYTGPYGRPVRGSKFSLSAMA